mgnify:CR=1 FL=1
MKPISKKDLRPAKQLDEAYFRATCASLAAEEFEVKWKAARKSSAYRFFRSFPHAWHLDLADVRRDRIPGGGVFALGDPHPSNFGFVTFEGGPRFVFDDLDDSGPGWAAIDACRYFAALNFLDLPKGAMPHLTRLYADITGDRDYRRRFPLDLVPDVQSASREELLEWTDGSSFRFDRPDLEPVADWRRAAIFAALDDEERARTFTVEAVARRIRKLGGSGGLSRFLVLGREPDGQTGLLELKELPVAATSWGRRLREPDDRAEHAMTALWGARPPHHRVVTVERVDYLLRSRLGRADVDVASRSGSAQTRVLEAQVSILASAHRGAYAREELERVPEWLGRSAKLVARRYAKVHAHVA